MSDLEVTVLSFSYHNKCVITWCVRFSFDKSHESRWPKDVLCVRCLTNWTKMGWKHTKAETLTCPLSSPSFCSSKTSQVTLQHTSTGVHLSLSGLRVTDVFSSVSCLAPAAYGCIILFLCKLWWPDNCAKLYWADLINRISSSFSLVLQAHLKLFSGFFSINKQKVQLWKTPVVMTLSFHTLQPSHPSCRAPMGHRDGLPRNTPLRPLSVRLQQGFPSRRAAPHAERKVKLSVCRPPQKNLPTTARRARCWVSTDVQLF